MVTGLSKGLRVATLDEVLATRARATFSHRINFQEVGYETLPKMKQWCEENCEDLWRCESTHALYFQFDDERDVINFSLRWS